MKLSIFCRIIGFCFCIGLLQFQNASAQDKYARTATYTVKAGDTAMAIARQHHTSLGQLLALNPGMQAGQIRPNQTIQVPASPSTQQQPAYIEYLVKRKDTPYSLAKAHGITVEELMEANPSLHGEGPKLKKGSVIRIPVKKAATAPQATGLRSIRVAVVLPFVGAGVEYERSTEFYRGMLLGIEALKEANINIHVSAYDEPDPDSSIQPLMQQVTAGKPDLIVGPLYPSHFADVSSASSHKTKVAIPFSSKVPQVDYRPDVFVLNTPSKYEASLAVDLFASSFKKQTTVVLLHSLDGNKKAFCVELQRRLLAAGYRILSLPASNSAEQIREAFRGNNKGEYVIVPDDARERTLQQLLPKLATLRQQLPHARISLVGYDAWIPLSEGSYKQAFHQADTYILAANYFYPYTQAAKAFTKKYELWFKTPMLDSRPRMAPLGFDFSQSFLGGLAAYGYDFNTQPPAANSLTALPKLQTDLRFISVGQGGGYLNRSMWLVHFKPDLTIVKLAAQ